MVNARVASSCTSPLLVGAGLLSLLAGCAAPEGAPALDPAEGGEPAVDVEDSAGAADSMEPAHIPPAVRAALAAAGTVELIVELEPVVLTTSEEAEVLDEAGLSPAALRDMDAEARAPVEARLRLARADILRGAIDGLEGRLPAGATLSRRYTHLPLALITVTREEALELLAEDPEVVAIHPQRVYTTTDAQSLGLIDQPEAQALGHAGDGVSVAILDTGLDYTRAAFGSCASPGAGGACRVVAAADFAPTDGTLDDSGLHGTNVAGIVGMVAPGASLIGLDVFRGASGYTSDIVAAIDWVIDNKAVYNIAAMNLSLGGGAYTAECPSDPFEVALAEAKAAGVAAAVATGNNGYTNKVASPACAPSAITVGAVYDSNMGGIGWSGCSDSTTAADKVTCFSNSASFQDLLAPGALITAAGVTMGGTSQATPHVAGALAVMRAAFPTDTVAQHVDRLRTTGVTITDHRNGLSFPRIDLDAAVAGAGLDCQISLSHGSTALGAGAGTSTLSVSVMAGCPWSINTGASWLTASPRSGTGPGSVSLTRTSNPSTARSAALTAGSASATVNQAANDTPIASLSIAGGAAWTKTRSVVLTTGGTDASGLSQMCVSTSDSCSYVTYASTLNYTLATGEGTKTLKLRVKDAHGLVSEWATDTIGLDTVAPTIGLAEVVPTDGGFNARWSGVTDATSGLSQVRFVVRAGTTAPTCTDTAAGTGSGASGDLALSGLTNGQVYAVIACATDVAGNTIAGAPAYLAPVAAGDSGAKLSINSGAAFSKSRTVTVALRPSGAPTQYCLSNTPTCTSFKALTATATWSLLAGDGTRTALVWYKDGAGAVSGPFADSVVVDATAPTNGTVSAARSDGSLALSWTGFTDARSGIVNYKVWTQASTAPACGRGTLAYDGANTTATLTGLTNGALVGVRVCATDAAGNTSTGATLVDRAATEGVAPTGTVSIAGGAEWVKGRTATLSLAATDNASGVTQMCVSNTATCTAWRAYATSLSWTLASGTGVQTVNVWYKDGQGNVSAVASDTIQADSTAPSGGTLSSTATAGGAALSWTGFVETGSGLDTVIVRYAAGTRAPSCTTGTEAGRSASGALTVSGLSAATAYSFRVCPVDEVGNVGAGLSRTLTTL
ncbi:MAG: S8 family serine peptidase [Deltaproteobacteria bacterium]|nr:S8 family serine peptidase [Deltaproteobacteria bacterium]